MERRDFIRDALAVAGGAATLAAASQAAAKELKIPEAGGSDPRNSRFWRHVREQFPLTESRTYLNTGGLGASPQVSIDALQEKMHALEEISEVGHTHDLWQEIKSSAGRLLGCEADELAYTRNTTEGINLIAASLGGQFKPGDEILCTIMEHHANLVPWQMVRERTGCTLRFANIQPSGQLDLDDWHAKLSERTRLVVVGHVSNVLGVINPVKELAAAAHKVGALILVDAAQSVPHLPVNVQELGCDFLACSAYKMLGPFGIGALWGRYELLAGLPPFITGGSMISSVTLEKTTFDDPPQRFEGGTPPIAGAVGFGAAIDYLNTIGMDTLRAREVELSRYLHERLAGVPGLQVLGGYFPGKPGIASFTMDCAHPHDIAQFLNEEGVAVRAGHHCAEPLHDFLGAKSSTRASLYLYSTEEEIDQMITALGTVREIFA
ncbi:cysteine desulfurase [bacterium]|nr:cysteine desulfurase [bacterium]